MNRKMWEELRDFLEKISIDDTICRFGTGLALEKMKQLESKNNWESLKENGYG